jgi:hypothetical protein
MAKTNDLKIKIDLSPEVKKTISAMKSLAELVGSIGQQLTAEDLPDDGGEVEVLRDQLDGARSQLRNLVEMNSGQKATIRGQHETIEAQSEELEQMAARLSQQTTEIERLTELHRQDPAERHNAVLLADAQRQQAADTALIEHQRNDLEEMKRRMLLMQGTLTSEINSVPGWEDFDGTPESTVGAAGSIIKQLATLRKGEPETLPSENRNDPQDGNTYVLRSVAVNHMNDPLVTITDIMGGHERTLKLIDWLKWAVA